MNVKRLLDWQKGEWAGAKVTTEAYIKVDILGRYSRRSVDREKYRDKKKT